MTPSVASVSASILDTIGNTPLVALRRLAPEESARVLVKLESANPTGSMKDRMARAMIEAAEADGRLTPGREVIEFTGGSTGTSLALVCAAKGYPLQIVTSDAFSIEKRNHMKALGATLTLVPSEGGRITPGLFVSMLALTKRLIAERGAYWTDQFNNPDQSAGYHALADEVWAQTDGRVDAFVHVVGTSGSLTGTATRLRGHQMSIRVTAVEPSTSAVLSGGPPGAHRIEGTGTGRVPPHFERALVDDFESVSTEDAEAMARRLSREEAIFAGTSSGANVAAALRVAARLGKGKTVVTLAVDSGLKYVSTELYR
jgi:cysteine synthase A